jgi:phosphoenolpyruvate carboxykinase (GTP)
MAMLPFCGYHMGDYFGHWLSVGDAAGDASKLPKIFYVNWFRKDESGRFLWPGFGENSRVLAWVFRRCDDDATTRETPIGLVPGEGALDVEGMDIEPEAVEELLRVDPEEWRAQLPQVHQHYAKFGDRLPPALREQLDGLESRLGAA